MADEAKLVNPKIILYPTKIVIEGYYDRVSKIENRLNVWNPVTHSYDFQAFIKDEINHRIIIPQCMNIKFLQTIFPNAKIEDKRASIDDSLKKLTQLKDIHMNYDCRDKIQEESVKYLKSKFKYRNTSYRFMQRFLCLKTGEGKTFCTVKTIADCGDRPIIFVDQETLAIQWKERIKEYTDTTEEEIFYISGAPSIKKLMKKSDMEIMKIKFFICCYRMVTSNIKSNGSSKEITELFNKIRVNLKVFDEAHVEYKSIFKIDMIYNARSIYLSATPKRTNKEEDKVYQNMFSMVTKFFSWMVEDEEEDENYHNIVSYNYSSQPKLIEQTNCSTKYGFSMARYCNYILNNKYDLFFSLLIYVLYSVILKNRKKKKIAILLGSNALIDKFTKDLIAYNTDKDYKLKVGILNGTIKKEDKQEILNNSDILVTTDKSFGKGVDVKNLQIVINTVPFSSETKLIQTIGRLRKLPNKEVIFFDINDIGFDAIKNQLKSKKYKVYKVIAKSFCEENYKPETIGGNISEI